MDTGAKCSAYVGVEQRGKQGRKVCKGALRGPLGRRTGNRRCIVRRPRQRRKLKADSSSAGWPCSGDGWGLLGQRCLDFERADGARATHEQARGGGYSFVPRMHVSHNKCLFCPVSRSPVGRHKLRLRN